ncbi:family 20 glycosylhydrolase [Pedobacter sp. MC2016-15]|uniref:beta-N-acetylhexosaminidase n=1 Tax=Pedobacter sp. MC2016-15 TaxID=2994473 RepID=UPI0022480D3C|nr:family 20 glycosylhydrolase [Pedobacter sp. MC2016-15]MCX2481371.1 family 20 glycosylhydrolase [Pedobacter sp. MC2016-15]
MGSENTNLSVTDSAAAPANRAPEFAIIPEPVSLLKTSGHFTLPENVVILATPEMKLVVDYLKEKISIPTGRFVSEYTNTSAPAAIRLMLNSKANPQLGNEGYQISVTPTLVVIKANKTAGLFYGVQSLLQLFPKEIESKELVKDINWTIPCVEVTDYPRLAWRGLMFDVARHFFTKQEVKQYIDAMVRYKYNLLHLHLTDDEGWRIEIKGLPKLTEVGAWNVKKTGEFGTFSTPGPDEPRNYGGFFTQDDLRELIQYAKDRFVDIMPEIDVPGHSLAAIASYPELSCTPGAANYRVRSGEKIMDWSRGAPPIALVDNTLCPANEKVYAFLDTIITQVAALFPFEYIHMGGDEAPENFWQKSDAIKALMQREGLKDMRQVQGYFEKRVQKIVESKGKKFMGWDEIMNSDIPASAGIMSWRSSQFGIQASHQKHEVIMAPQTNVYIDLMQGDVITEPKVYNSVRLPKAYEFDPVPAGADPKYIRGAQANLWTEQIYNIRQAEYMTWPRGYAIAESIWSPKEKKNWTNFIAKMEQHFKRMDVAETKYAPSIYDPIFKASRAADRTVMVELITDITGLDIYYSFDNSFPDKFYPKYTEKVPVPKDANQMRVITYRDNKPIGRMITIPVDELNKRAGRR